MSPGVGLVLQPDEAYLELLDDVLQTEVDYYEVAPETLWFEDEEGRLHPNGFFRRFAALREDTKRPFVAHGVGQSIGTSSRGQAARRRRNLRRLADDHRVFDFRWYTDHLGATTLDDLAITLPLSLPMTAYAAKVAARCLRAMQGVVPDVGVENSMAHFVLGDPLAEPAFLSSVVRAPHTHLLLDLHNVYTMGLNLGFDPRAYLAKVDHGKVIEIHLSGGSLSDPNWLPSGRTLRLDGHDGPVPDEVWALFEEILPRCRNLRGVTVERMEGTVAPGDVPLLRDEVRRARRILQGRAG